MSKLRFESTDVSGELPAPGRHSGPPGDPWLLWSWRERCIVGRARCLEHLFERVEGDLLRSNHSRRS
jgi:hypothetical protein